MILDAVVPAGGRARRLGGRRKVELLAGGVPLLRIAVDTALELGARRVAVVGPPPTFALPSGVLRVREDPPFSGPAAALGRGLDALDAAASGAGEQPAGRVLVLAADAPRAADALAVLLPALADHPRADGVRAVDRGRVQPLLAVYRGDPLRSVLARGPLADAALLAVLGGLELVDMSVPEGSADDVDTPADAARLGVVLDGPAPDSAVSARSPATADSRRTR